MNDENKTRKINKSQNQNQNQKPWRCRNRTHRRFVIRDSLHHCRQGARGERSSYLMFEKKKRKWINKSINLSSSPFHNAGNRTLEWGPLYLGRKRDGAVVSNTRDEFLRKFRESVHRRKGEAKCKMLAWSEMRCNQKLLLQCRVFFSHSLKPRMRWGLPWWKLQEKIKRGEVVLDSKRNFMSNVQSL